MQKASDKETEVGGALGKAAHEIRDPIVAVGDVDAQAIAVFHQHALQVGTHAVQHLKLEIVFGNLPGGCRANGFRDHARVVRGDSVVKAAAQKNFHQTDIVEISVSFARVGDVRGFFIGAL